MERLERNLAGIRARIATACAGCGRSPGDVALVAVTKYAGAGYARALLDLGQRDLGENRVKHLLSVAGALEGAGARWHMIGHLQRNKARKVAGVIDVLHSLDSLELARELQARRPAEREALEAYVQVHMGGDPGVAGAPGRSGIQASELPRFLEAVTGLTRLRVVGLMGLPPLGDPGAARPHFRSLRALSESVEGLKALSMGMTSDLEVAIEEGATVVRVGRALLEGLSPAAREADAG